MPGSEALYRAKGSNMTTLAGLHTAAMKKSSRRTRQEQEILDWMREAADAGDCVDGAGVVSPTLLAEAACDEWDAYDEDGEIPELFFDLAAEVAEDYQ